MSNKAQPATKDELKTAILTVLGSLPAGADFHFFWRDGVQHMALKFQDGTETVAMLNRRKDGSGQLAQVLH